jgi:hypothetical protein
LPSSALKCVPRIKAIRGVYNADCQEKNNRRADLHRQKYEFESGLPQA